MFARALAALAAATLILPPPVPASLRTPDRQAPAPASHAPADTFRQSEGKPTSPAAPAGLRPAPTGPRPAAEEMREEIRDLARRGRLDSALALCRRALELDSSDAFARFMAGKLSPEGKASAEHFKQVLEAGGGGEEAGESRFRLGQYHYAAGKYHLAIPYFRDYLRLHPKGDWREPAQYWMGSACLALAQSRPDRAAYLDTALAYLRKLLELSPPEQYYHALALEGMAKVRLAKGDLPGAWEAVQGALEKAPEDERASILLLAAQLRRNADRDAERRFLARLAKEHPQSPEVRHLRRLNGNPDPSRWRAPAVPGAPRPATDTAGVRKDSVKSVTAAAASPGPGTRDQAAQGTAVAANETAVAAQGTVAAAYTLQLGAFAQAANAQGMIAELSRMGFSPEMSESSRGGKKIYQVRLGRFATMEEAQEYARINLKPRKLLSQAVPLN